MVNRFIEKWIFGEKINLMLHVFGGGGGGDIFKILF